jgi:hypothetical protein
MNAETLILFMGLIVVNLWHSYVVIARRGGEGLDTISQRAALYPKTLKFHKIIHYFVSICLILYVLIFLRYQAGAEWTSMLLLIGAFFDVIQVETLTKESGYSHRHKDPHELSAWMMAFFYMLAGVGIAKLSGLPGWLSNAIWLIYAVVVLLAFATKFRGFFVIQMIYFVALSILIVTAHLSLV